MVRSHLTAWVAAASAIVLATAAAFGIPRPVSTPAEFYLPPSTASGSSADLDAIAAAAGSPARTPLAETSRRAALLSGAASSTRIIKPLPRTTSNPIASTPIVTEPIGLKANPPNGWTPWGMSTSRLRNTWMSPSSGAAALGGLWHAMSPFARGAGTADTPASTTARVETPASPAQAAKPSPSPAPKPAPAPSPAPSASGGLTAPPSGGGPSVGASSPATPSGATPPASAPEPGGSAGPPDPTDPGSGLGEDSPPLPDLGPGPPPGSGGSGDPLGGGSGPGGGTPPGGDLSPTPEPSTIALVGTGLIGLIGVLKRRRRM